MRAIYLLLLLSGAIYIHACPNFGSQDPWRVSFNITEGTLYIELIGNSGGYYVISNLNFAADDLSIGIHWLGPGSMTMYPSPQFLEFQSGGDIQISENTISYSGSSAFVRAVHCENSNIRSFNASASNSNGCTGLYQSSGSVGDFCPAQFYIGSVAACTSYSCYPCDCGCKTNCYGPGVGQCCDASCASCFGSLDSTCVTCSSGYYMNTTNQTCLPCNVACATCTSSDPSACPSCNSGYYLQPAPSTTTCLATCPVGYYPDSTNNTCQPCDESCHTCNGGTANNCTSCKLGGSTYLYHSMCTSCPAIGYYPNTTTQICDNCDPTCYTCNGGQFDNCVSCSGSFYLFMSSCRACPIIGYYPNTTDHVCYQCNSSCNSCTSSTNTSCTSCRSVSYLFNHSCSLTCPTKGYYSDNATNLCTKCYSGCNTCTAGTSSSCTSCIAGFYLLNTAKSCAKTCPAGFWADPKTNSCQACNSSCATCPDPVNCTTCASTNPYFYNQSCYTHCPRGTYPIQSNISCTLCPQGCLSCGSPLTCNRCASGYSLYKDPATKYRTCVQTCPSGYFSSYNTTKQCYVCHKCDNLCTECNGPNSNNCTDCPGSEILSAGTCFAASSSFSCPSGTYLEASQCLSCTQGCASCSDVTACNQCLDGYTLGTTTGQCELPQSSCDPSCNTCSGTTQYGCTSCTSPLVLQTGMCLRACSAGFTYNVMSNQCEICFESCTSCIAELFYFGGTCVFSCPDETDTVIDETGQLSCNLEDGPPLVSFSQQPSQTTPVALNQDVTIQMSVIYPSSSSSSINVINWIQTDVKAPVTKLLQGISNLNTPSIVIPKNNLVPNTYYELTVQILLNGQIATTAITSFTTAQSIVGGTFNVIPSIGNFYNTVFTLTLSGWDANVANNLSLLFSIIASRNDNPNNKVMIATSLDLLNSASSSFGTYHQFTVPSLFEHPNEQDVVYSITVEADSSSDTLVVSKTIVLQPLSADTVSQLIANTDPATLTEPAAMASFAILAAQNLVQSSALETQTTTTMITAFQTYQTLTGDYSVTCINSIHCSGHGTCLSSTGTTSRSSPLCTCNPGWGGSTCNKDAQQLQQAQQFLNVVLTNLLSTPPTVDTVGSQLLAVQAVVQDTDLILPGSSVPNLMTRTVISGYNVVSSSDSSLSSSQSSLSTIANTAIGLINSFSDIIDSSDILDELSLVFGDSLQDLLSLLGLGDSSLIDSSFLYAFLADVDDLFEDVLDEDESSEDGGRRILQQQKEQLQRQPPRIISSSSTDSAAKQQAALQNKAATQTPFESTPTINLATLKQILSALLSALQKGRTVKMKTEQQYSTATGSFQLPQLVLQTPSTIKFQIQESGKNTQASNSNTVVTSSITFSVSDGTNPISISNLQNPIQMAIPKTTPSTPSSSGSNMYQCSYYDETSKRFLTNGCSFVGENLTHIFCKCNHATEFAAQINQDALNAFDNVFNKPSLQELLELSVQQVSSKNDTFKLELQKNILAKSETAVHEYTLLRFDCWPVGVSVIILVILIVLYPLFESIQSVKKNYLASWSDEFSDLNTKTTTATHDSTNDSNNTQQDFNLATSAKYFWSLYSLFFGKYQKNLTEYTIRTLTFYTEVLNLMGNAMAWTIFLNSQKARSLMPQGQTTVSSYVFVVAVSFVTATVSLYATVGLINLRRIRSLQNHYQKIEAQQISSTKKLASQELFYLVFCFLLILGWIALFAVLSTILLNSEVKYWLSCCLGAAILSYVVIDTLMVVIYRKFKPKKMLLMLAIRNLSSEYLTLTVYSEISNKNELHLSSKQNNS